MFNGLIREFGEVVKFDGKTLSLKSSLKPNIGDSIAVNGACLSVVKVFYNGFNVELSDESKSVLAVQNLKGKVHLEPALKVGDRVDGHFVQGHIDGLGEIYKITTLKSGFDFFIKLPSNLMPLMAHKGSVAIDGVSLTINEVLKDGIRLTIIPLTMKDTLFGEYKVGRVVNVESDLLARYTKRILDYKDKKKELSWEEIDHISSLY
ncbi:riboflavin synthase [Campylobacter ureolyticus]|jgi:riboflavin synthase, alpha subunit|uniref:Riboflavin synthase n=1 Tax=Campylobacter ureolyticus TaxID=827 RepID=A0A9Q4KPJ1_9BACT|nr:riboflavin synthase [Campylobacter ureolyticus]MCZ6102840.1 riboflavin synthase [Campylobacter ureolyticus]MCZ6116966.1 riboflavin synthase [Campylobacter ureolyticus]MCZ6133136.1 riboflavin synthase [Campylobacter ureolyticus]MCZ6134333.1 riboflavin synthase [Campylobacter ureolyticus]MCZ6161376.1 riboflavin synthase [Campylobacter ureolyticus]